MKKVFSMLLVFSLVLLSLVPMGSFAAEKESKLSQEKLDKYNKVLDRLQKAFEKGGYEAVEKVHLSLGHKKLKEKKSKDTVSVSSIANRTNMTMDVVVWMDPQDYNYIWEGTWDLGDSSVDWESSASKAYDVVGLAIMEGSSPYDYLEGWSMANSSLQRISIMDDYGYSRDANASFESFDKYGITWSYQDEQDGAFTIGHSGYVIAQLNKRQTSQEDFKIVMNYAHTYENTNDIWSVGFSQQYGGMPTININWTYSTEPQQWIDEEVVNFSDYPLGM